MFSQEQHCQGLLQTYTGERIKVLGEMQVQVKYGKQRKPQVLVVVDGTGPGLFGRNWLEQLRLDWKRIGAIAVERNPPVGVDQLCAKYSDVFNEELGTIQEYQANLKVDNLARPKFFKTRSVPYAIRDAVGREIDQKGSWRKWCTVSGLPPL